jgi:hypothetical protein
MAEQVIADPPTTAAGGRRRDRLRDRRFIAAAFAAAWVLPVCTHLLRADLLLVLVVAYLVGGLLRVGSTVVDRLMATAGVMVGAAITGGLLFSVWPWGLNPIPVAGLTLTVLVATMVWLRRPPAWPRRFRGSDIMVGFGWLLGTAVAILPILIVQSQYRIGYIFITGDRARHFNLFDAIHRVGGYTFIKTAAARSIVDPGMLNQYPPGSHFTYALFDTFLVSGSNPGSPTAESFRYMVYVSMGYGFLVATTAWAARWVAGPALSGWRAAFLVTGVGAFLGTGVMTSAIWCTWDSQVFAMCFLALLAAFSFRPPPSLREHVLLLVALTIAIGFSYQLFLPLALVLVASSALVYRKRWLRHWKPVLLVAVLTTPVALVPIIVSETAGLSSSSLAVVTGFTIPMTRQSLAIMAALLLLGAVSATARRRPTLWAAGIAVGGSGLAVVAFALYQHHTIGTTTYYYEKAVEAWVVIALIGIGACGHLLKRIPKPGRRFTAVLASVLAALAAVVATGSVSYGAVQFSRPNWTLGPHTTWGVVWASAEQIYPSHAGAIGYLDQLHYLGDGVPTLVLFADDQTENTQLSLVLACMNHDVGAMANPVYALASTQGLADAPEADPLVMHTLSDTQQQSLTTLEQSIKATPFPLRVLANDLTVATALEQYEAAHPGLHLNVIYLPKMPTESSPQLI